MQNSNAVSLNENVEQSIGSSNIFKNPLLSDTKRLKDNNGVNRPGIVGDLTF
ncbi:hypothetical protein [Psychrobacter sp. AntiMn-1]|uniref:hypothetical protein n=1 Tax=Psychrobacter sp. AntiMn-1 TaxID=1720344 RepID=UPI0012EAA151|nr:hypothetical protein [Psychrobacter sp. AntiMn-1]